MKTCDGIRRSVKGYRSMRTSCTVLRSSLGCVINAAGCHEFVRELVIRTTSSSTTQYPAKLLAPPNEL